MINLRKLFYLKFSAYFLILSCSPNSGKEKEIKNNHIVGIDSTFFLSGEALFKFDCNKCHVAKNRLHNYLEGVVQRVGISYLKLYLTRQDSLISAKDSNALYVKNFWGNLGNSHNFKYTEEELNYIIEYLK